MRGELSVTFDFRPASFLAHLCRPPRAAPEFYRWFHFFSFSG